MSVNDRKCKRERRHDPSRACGANEVEKLILRWSDCVRLRLGEALSCFELYHIPEANLSPTARRPRDRWPQRRDICCAPPTVLQWHS